MLTAAIGLLVFLLALDQGGYGLGTRGAAGILIWWSLLVLVAAGIWPRAAVPRAALVTGGLLAAFCVLTGVSALWADSAEGAFLELGRVGIYLGVFAVAVAAAARGGMAAWTDGLAGGIAAVAVLALADRCFSWHEPAELRSFLPGAEVRLGYPLGYWNALGILLGIGVPLLLRPAVASGRTLVRGVAAGALPAMGIALFLTSSRGGVIVAAVGALAFVALAGRALLALSALAIGGAATAVAVAVLEARSEFLDGPLESAAAVSQGKSAAPLLLLACVVSGVVYALASRALMGRRLRLRRSVLVAAGAVAVLVVSAAVVVADPGARFEDFKTPPNLQATDRAGFVRDHLLSGEGSGRWQFWSAAVDQFEEHPFAGDGAGSYQAWWLRHGSLAFFVQDAHSLYLETLGELGLLGLALLAGALVAALVAAGRRLRESPDDLRPAMAAAIAALVAFAVGAAIDWIWEMTVVGVIGAICLGLVTGPAGLAADARPPRARPPRARPRPRRFARVAFALVACCVIAVEAIPWMVDRQLRASREALEEGDSAAAETRAFEARALQPWAASPHLQLALVRENHGDLEGARGAIDRALELEPANWQLWLVSARVRASEGEVRQARRDFAQARRLHPRSPLFESDDAARARLRRALGGG